MRERADSPVITVGVDGSRTGRHALHWAVSEAIRTEASLRVVHALPEEAPVSLGNVPEFRAAGRRLLTRAVNEAQDIVGDDVAVRGVLARGTSGDVLVRQSSHSTLMVVGTRGYGRLADLVIGSTACHVAAHARCPVVTVPRREQIPPDESRGRIVVGIGSPESSDGPLRVAVDQARTRGLPLEALHAWAAPNSSFPFDNVSLDISVVRQRHEDAGRDLAAVLQPWRERHPELAVTQHVVQSAPARALSAASKGADLLVVGSRGRSALFGLLLGSVSQGVLRGARCPVIVAREPHQPATHGTADRHLEG